MSDKNNLVQNLLIGLFIVLALAVLVLVAGAFQFSASLQKTTTIAETALATAQGLQTKVALPAPPPPTVQATSAITTTPQATPLFIGGGIAFADNSGQIVTRTLYVVNDWRFYSDYEALGDSSLMASRGRLRFALVRSAPDLGQWHLYWADQMDASAQWITYTVGLVPRLDSSNRASSARLAGTPEMLLGDPQKIITETRFSSTGSSLRDDLDAMKNAGANLPAPSTKLLLIRDDTNLVPIYTLAVIPDPNGPAVNDPYYPRPYPYYYYYHDR